MDSHTMDSAEPSAPEEMGGCVSANKREEKEEAVDELGPDELQPALDEWHQDLLEKTVLTSPDHALKHAAIVTYPKPLLLAAYPPGFKPSKKGIIEIIEALEGDTSAIAENGLQLGPGCLPGIPGKLDAGKAIYGTDAKEGGTDAFRSKVALLVGQYIARPAASTLLLRRTAMYMEEQGK